MLEKILEYQNVESQLISAENELSKSKDREKASQIQQVLKNQHSRLIMLEENAKHINTIYKKANDKYNDFVEKLNKLEKEMESAEPEKASIYEKAYKDFSAISTSLEKEITNIYNEIQNISKEYENIIRKSKVDRETFDKYKASYAKLKGQKDPIINELKNKLSELEKKIEKDLFAKYKQKRESRLFPIFVELNNNKCGGCRMEISASKLGQMKTNKFGVIECENCGRYIYKN